MKILRREAANAACKTAESPTDDVGNIDLASVVRTRTMIPARSMRNILAAPSVATIVS